MIPVYYQLDAESKLDTKAFEEGALYFCTDTRRIFLDPVGGTERILINGDPIILATETDRENILAPIPGKFYIVIDSASMYVYYSGAWTKIGGSNSENNLVITLDNNTDTASHSYSEIAAAAAAGIMSYVVYGSAAVMPLVAFGSDDTGKKCVAFSLNIGYEQMSVKIYDDETNSYIYTYTDLTPDIEKITASVGQIAKVSVVSAVDGHPMAWEAVDMPKDGYTPVKGTDYWTDEDKAEIKSYVDEAILGGEW